MIGKILITLSVACLAYGAPKPELDSVTGLAHGTGPGIVQTDAGLEGGQVLQGSDVTHTFPTGTGGIEVEAGGKVVTEGTGITEGFRKIETETPFVGGVSGHGFVHPVGVPSPTFKSGFNWDGGITYSAPTGVHGWWNGLGHQAPGFEYYGKSLSHIPDTHTGIVGQTGILGGQTGILGGHTGIVGGHSGTLGSYPPIEGYSATHGFQAPELWSGLYKSEYHDVHGKPSGISGVVPSAGLVTGLSGRNYVAGPVGIHGSKISGIEAGFGTTGLLPKIGGFGTSGAVSPKISFPFSGIGGRSLYGTVNTYGLNYGTSGIVPKSYGLNYGTSGILPKSYGLFNNHATPYSAFGTRGFFNHFYTTPYYNQPAYGGYAPPTTTTTTVQPVYGQVQPIYGQVQPAGPAYGQVQPIYSQPGYAPSGTGYYPGQATYYPHQLYHLKK